MQARRRRALPTTKRASQLELDPVKAFSPFEYAFRGVGSKKEVENVLKGGKSGGFWSNYPGMAMGFAKAALFVTKNPYPNEPQVDGEVVKGEIPYPMWLSFDDMDAIYLNAKDWGYKFRFFIRIKPVVTLEEWLRYYNKHRPGREELHKRLYFKLYGLPEVLHLFDYSRHPEYWEWAEWIRENKGKYLS